MQNILLGFFLLTVGGFIILFLMTYRKSQKNLHKICTASIIGRIEDFEISHHRGEKLYTEICTYEVNKKVYTTKSSTSLKKKLHEIGDEILICYQPENPNNAFIAHDIKINPLTDIILWSLLILCIIGCIIMF